MKPGTRIGAYEILAAIGAGGMGEVYRARHVERPAEEATVMACTEANRFANGNRHKLEG